jgi:uncharacterized protein YcbK (DUF882 family)
MGDLSAHFSRAEFKCRHCGHLHGPALALVAVLERIRSISGKPLTVVSGYRCPVHNRAVGGAINSRHLHGDAADIPRGRATLAQARAAGAVGVGTSGEWATHVDVRPGGPAHWRY